MLVLEADSDAAVLSSGLTAACAAVADAGILLTGLVVGSLVVSEGINTILTYAAAAAGEV